jgi:tyrosyl-tRNA synthetase
MKPVAEQLALIRRGAEQVVPEADLVRKLERSVASGRPLRVKYGIDPTGIDVHLGHTVGLRKLRQFQELGHQAVIIIGDWTALVGDPSGRDQSRKGLTREQIEANARDYLKQVGKVVDLTRSEVRHNGEWFGKFTLADVLALTRQITVQRMLERDDFTKRFRAEPSVPIYLSECLYPLMQGRDSVEIKADVELGGTEQLYNLMVGRDLQADAGQEPQVCVTVPILRGLDGHRRMGKSLGNYVGVGEEPCEQFGKTMSIPDNLMSEWFTLLTDRPADEIARLVDPNQTHPRQAKEVLGKDIVSFYYGADAAEAAAVEFRRRFSEHQLPTDIPEVDVPSAGLVEGKLPVTRLLVAVGLAKSNNQARQLVEGGGVALGEDRRKVTDPNLAVPLTSGLIVHKGRHVVRVRLS